MAGVMLTCAAGASRMTAQSTDAFHTIQNLIDMPTGEYSDARVDVQGILTKPARRIGTPGQCQLARVGVDITDIGRDRLLAGGIAD